MIQLSAGPEPAVSSTLHWAANSFGSVLFDREQPPAPDPQGQPPAYFADLHLDDIVAAVIPDRETSTLARVFYEPLRTLDSIAYRHDVFRDLEDPALVEAIRAFGEKMTIVQRWLLHASKAQYDVDRHRWRLSAAGKFCAAVGQLSERLEAASLRSAALVALRGYVAAYVASEPYRTLLKDTQRMTAALSGLRYRIRVHGPKVTVTRYRDEPDFSNEVLTTFEKFRQAVPSKRYEWRFDPDSDMNHVEAAILDRVARLHPQPFAALRDYAEQHEAFLDPVIARFDQEIRFYLAWLDFLDRVRRGTGLAFCLPKVSEGPAGVEALGIFDLALAASGVDKGKAVVANDLKLLDGERVVLVSGPNQGGKTTFARAIGQLHHLARVGVPVPGASVRLPLVDAIFTHFERTEQVEDLSSKLEQDLRRIHAILARATARSLLIMNESFTSTTVADQLFIGRRIVGRILDCGLMCVAVTFLDELAKLDAAIVSMVSTVDPEDYARRTFEIVRRPPDGLAYAVAIAEKYRLTYAELKTRLRP